MLMYEIWTLGKKPFPRLSSSEVHCIIIIRSTVYMHIKFAICHYIAVVNKVTASLEEFVRPSFPWSSSMYIVYHISMTRSRVTTLVCILKL